MTKTRSYAVTKNVYFGSGKSGEKLVENLQKRVPLHGSLSRVILELLRKADPTLFKGVDDGKRG